MYIIEVSNGMITAEKRCKSEWKATKIASTIADAGYILISNPELNTEQKRFEVRSVRVYDTKHPSIDIDF